METNMKQPKFRSAVAVGLLMLATPLMAQQPQVINVPLSRPGDPVFLEIGIQSAHIEVIGEDRDDAEFEIIVADGDRRIVTPSGTQPLKGGGYSLEVEEDDNEIHLDMDWRVTKVSVVARIPKRADVELQTINDGEIIVSNLIGNLELYNTNGPITARNVSGSVIAESVNDTIDIAFDSFSDDGASSMESINGDLILALPAGVGVTTQLDTSRGEIYSDFEVEVRPVEQVIERDDTRNGVSIQIESVIVADINGGGHVVRMKSLHGDLNIRKR
jgi:DUF4097 and DUF4098 domain-containing protein YvlB